MTDQNPTGKSTATFRGWRRVILWLCGIAAINATYLFLTPAVLGRLMDDTRRLVAWGPNRGFFSRTFYGIDGIPHRYMVFVPHSMVDSEKRPLLVYLNGNGENGSNEIAPLRNALAQAIWENERHVPFVVVWPQCQDGDVWKHGSQSTVRALEIMHAVAGEFHTDPDRVYLSGISSGGAGTWAIAAENSDLFAAMIPVSATVDHEAVKRVAEAKLPIWSYAVEDDGAALVGLNRQAHVQLLEAGLSPHLTEVGTRGNSLKDGHDAWSFAYRDGGMYRWLAAQRRSNRRGSDRRFKRIDLTTNVESGVTVEVADSTYGTVARVPAGSGDKVVKTKTPLSGSGSLEVHLEFRATGKITRFGAGRFRAENLAKEQGILIDLAIDDLNSGGLYAWPDHVCLAAASPVAERAFYANGWNDLRLKFHAGRLTVELNGWELLDAVEAVFPSQESVLGFVARGESSAFVDVRNLRVSRSDLSAAPEVVPAQVRSQPTVPTESEGVAPVTVATLIGAWKRREQSTPGVDLAWTVEGGSRFAESSFGPPDRPVVDDTSPSHISRLTLSHDQVRHTTPWRHPRLDLTRKAGLGDATSLQDFKRSFDAKFTTATGQLPGNLRLDIVCDAKHRSDGVSDADGRGYRGIVFDRPDAWRDRIGEMDDLLWRAPLLALRPLAKSGVNCQTDSCVILPEMAWVSGARCWVIEETTQVAGANYQRRFWVDPLRDFLILRQTVSVDGLLREQLDVQYALNSKNEWLPVSWEAMTWPRLASSISEFQFPGNEWLFQTASAKTVSERASDAVVHETSAMQFQPETVVFDQSASEWFEQVSVGERRKLSADEARELVMNGSVANHDSSRFYKAIGGGLVLLLAGWACVRRIRRVR